MSLQRTLLPRLIVIITTVVMTAYYLFGNLPELKFVTGLSVWGSIITAWVLIGATGVYLLRLGLEVKEHRLKYWFISILEIFLFVMFLGIGIIYGSQHPAYAWTLNNLITPISTVLGTVICSMAFFPSAYRLMRIRGLDSLALMTGFFLILIQQTPVFQATLQPIVNGSLWLMNYPITYSLGGAYIGVSLAGLAIIIRTMAGQTRGVT